MGCCEGKALIADNDNEHNDFDKSSSMMIITFDPDEEAKKNKRNKKQIMNQNDGVVSDDDNDEDCDIIGEYVIDETDNRVKVTKKVKTKANKNEAGEEDEGDDNMDYDNISEAQRAKMTPNKLIENKKTHKTRLELTMKMKEEAKKEYCETKDYLDSVEKLCAVRIDDFKPQVILAEYSIKIHKDIINCLITIRQIDNILYATCSEDKTIKFWNEDFNQIEEIETESEPKILLQYNTQYILSAENNIIIAYEFGSYSKAFIFKDHLSKITTIALKSDMQFASGGYDCIIRIWDINDSDYNNNEYDSNSDNIKCKSYFNGHTSAIIKIIELEPDTMISCSEDKSVVIWDSKLLSIMVKLNNYFTTISLVKTNEVFLLGAYDNKLRIYSKDIQMKQVLTGRYYNIKHILLIGKDYIAITNSTKKIYIIDKEYKTIEYIYKGQRSLITSMVSHDLSKNFVTSGDDGKVYIWPKPFKPEDD